MSRVVIFANGELPDIEAAHALLRVDDCLIAADGGVNHLLKMGIFPEIVIGDLDSISADVFNKLLSAEVKIKKYPIDKNETDIELALQYAINSQPSAILIVGALGGRLDQTLTNLSLLTSAMLSGLDVCLDDGVEEVYFCRKLSPKEEPVKILGRSGDTISLIPWQGPVEGVITTGLQWPIKGETLYPDKSRGVSNVLLGEMASVRISSGLLLIIHRRQPVI